MEMKIFNHILYGNLMPWLYDNKEIRTLTENLKQVGNKQPETEGALLLQIQTLLSHKLDLVKWLKNQKADNSKPLIELYFSTQLPDFTDTISKFYSIVIDKESQRIFNAYVNLIEEKVDPLLINFQTTTILRTLKRYIIAAANEIRNRGYAEIDLKQTPLIPFVLYLMKFRLITLYFSIQEVKKNVLENVTELDDFYLMELNETKKDIHPIFFEGPEEKSISRKDAGKIKKLSFGFHGNTKNLKIVVDQLCIQVGILDEDKSPADMLVHLLTSKDIKPGAFKIYLNCETKIFRFILNKFKSHFSSLTLRNVDKSKSFYSKENHEKTISENNLSVSGIGDIKPEAKTSIESIFKQLQ